MAAALMDLIAADQHTFQPGQQALGLDPDQAFTGVKYRFHRQQPQAFNARSLGFDRRWIFDQLPQHLIAATNLDQPSARRMVRTDALGQPLPLQLLEIDDRALTSGQDDHVRAPEAGRRLDIPNTNI